MIQKYLMLILSFSITLKLVQNLKTLKIIHTHAYEHIATIFFSLFQRLRTWFESSYRGKGLKIIFAEI